MTKLKTKSSDSIFRQLIGGSENEQTGEDIPTKNEIGSIEKITMEPSTPQEVVETPTAVAEKQQEKAEERVDEVLKILDKAMQGEKKDKQKPKAQPKEQEDKEEEQESLLAKNKPMQFNLPIDLRRKIKERAFRKDVTGTKIVIEALSEYFNRLEAGENKKNSLKS